MAKHTVQFQRQQLPADGVHAELGTPEKVPESSCRQHLFCPLGTRANRSDKVHLFPRTLWDCRDPVAEQVQGRGGLKGTLEKVQ